MVRFMRGAKDGDGERRTRIRLPPDVRRERILDAATRILLEDESQRLTMDRVAAEAGVAKGTMYYYWDSRTALFQDLQWRYIQQLFATAETLQDSGATPYDLLESFLRRAATLHYRQRRLLAALAREVSIEEAEITGKLLEVIVAFVCSLDERPAGDPEFVASFLLAGLHGVLIRLFQEPEPDLERVIEQALEVCRRVLGLPAPEVSRS